MADRKAKGKIKCYNGVVQKNKVNEVDHTGSLMSAKHIKVRLQ